MWCSAGSRAGWSRAPPAPRGKTAGGKTRVIPGGRGSSSSSSVLAEAIRAGTAPAAIVLLEPDPIVALGAIVARELYGTSVPVVVASDVPRGRVRVSATGGSGRIGPA